MARTPTIPTSGRGRKKNTAYIPCSRTESLAEEERPTKDDMLVEDTTTTATSRSSSAQKATMSILDRRDPGLAESFHDGDDHGNRITLGVGRSSKNVNPPNNNSKETTTSTNRMMLPRRSSKNVNPPNVEEKIMAKVLEAADRDAVSASSSS